MQYLTRINQNFKNRYKKYNEYLKKKDEQVSFEEELEVEKPIPKMEEKMVINLLVKNVLTRQKTRNTKKQKTMKLKTKKTKKFNVLLDNFEDNFLITQLESKNQKKNSLVDKKPFLEIFEEKKLLKEKILEAIEKVKFDKKWIAS